MKKLSALVLAATLALPGGLAFADAPPPLDPAPEAVGPAPINLEPGPVLWNIDDLAPEARQAFDGEIVLNLTAEQAERHLFLEARQEMPRDSDHIIIVQGGLKVLINGWELPPFFPSAERGYRLIDSGFLVEGENVISFGNTERIPWAQFRLTLVPDDNALRGCGKCGGVRPIWMESAPANVISQGCLDLFDFSHGDVIDFETGESVSPREGAFGEDGIYGATELQRQYDALHYTLDLTFANPLDGSFTGNVTMLAEVVEGPLLNVQIDMDDSLDLMEVEIRLAPDGEFAPAVWTEGEGSDDHTLFIEFPGCEPVPAGQQFETRIAYGGLPDLEGFFGVWLNTNGDVTSVGVPFEASKWWPCKDWPEDKAVATLIYTAPAELTAVGNGHLVSTETADGMTAWRYESQHPVATYNVVCNVGDLQLYEETFEAEPGVFMPVKHYFEADRFEPLPAWLKVTDALRVYHDTWGPYPFLDDGYGMVASDVGGGMEHQTIPSMGRNLNSELTVAHELAHQWFGDAVSVDRWNDTWLSEGFATYCEAIYWEQTRGHGFYLNLVNAWKAELNTTGSVLVPAQNTDNPNALFGNKVYDKGAIVLHATRGRIGDEAFFQAIREYVATYRYKTVRSQDFIDICEAISGEDLEGFFRGWLEGTTRPRARWGVSLFDGGDEGPWGIAMDARQLPGATTYDMRLPIDVELEDGSIVRVRLRSTELAFQANYAALPGRPVAFERFEEYWLGDYFEASAGATLRIISEMPNAVAGLGQAFSADLLAAGSPEGATVSVDPDFGGGALPPGLELVDLGGGAYRIEGTPTQAGAFEFRLRVETRFLSEAITNLGPPMRITVQDGTMSDGFVAR